MREARHPNDQHAQTRSTAGGLINVNSHFETKFTLKCNRDGTTAVDGTSLRGDTRDRNYILLGRRRWSVVVLHFIVCVQNTNFHARTAITFV